MPLIVNPHIHTEMMDLMPNRGINPCVRSIEKIDDVATHAISTSTHVENMATHASTTHSHSISTTPHISPMRARIEKWGLFNTCLETLEQLLLVVTNSYVIDSLRHGASHVESFLSGAQSVLKWIALFNVFTLALTGVISMAEVVFKTGPESMDKLHHAQTLVAALEGHAASLEEHMNETLKDAHAILRIEAANFWNHFWNFFVGAGHTTSAILSFLSTTVADSLHYDPVLVGKAAVTANLASGILLGIFCIARGIASMWSAAKSLEIIHHFQARFEAAGRIGLSAKEKIENMMAFMKKQENLGPEFSKHLFNSKFIEKIDGSIDAASTISVKEQLSYLKIIHKRIYSEEMKQKLDMILGVFLILAGIAIIVASTVFSGGMNIAIIGLVSAIFYVLRDVCKTGHYSMVFAAFRDWCYSTPEWLNQLNEGEEDVVDEVSGAKRDHESVHDLCEAENTPQGIEECAALLNGVETCLQTCYTAMPEMADDEMEEWLEAVNLALHEADVWFERVQRAAKEKSERLKEHSNSTAVVPIQSLDDNEEEDLDWEKIDEFVETLKVIADVSEDLTEII